MDGGGGESAAAEEQPDVAEFRFAAWEARVVGALVSLAGGVLSRDDACKAVTSWIFEARRASRAPVCHSPTTVLSLSRA